MPDLSAFSAGTSEYYKYIINKHNSGDAIISGRFFYMCDGAYYHPDDIEDLKALETILTDNPSLDVTCCASIKIPVEINFFGYAMPAQLTIENYETPKDIIDRMYPELIKEYIRDTYPRERLFMKIGDNVVEDKNFFEYYHPASHLDSIQIRLEGM
ncbi:hypothetical protein BX667DRAFT_503431 [Coemansia mojavensis]|nr:hypothetical protein BX667DRAFT_503431 [Coemansia mojavensis]